MYIFFVVMFLQYVFSYDFHVKYLMKNYVFQINLVH
jgi:hypothetical protein